MIKILFLVYLIIIIASILIAIKEKLFPLKIFKKSEKFRQNLDFGDEGDKLPPDSEIKIFRDIPCDNDIFKAYWICKAYNLVNINKLEVGIIGAILLKLVKNKNISIEEKDIKNKEYIIVFNNKDNINTESENKLWEILNSASGDNKILDANELKSYCHNKGEVIKKLFDILDDETTRMLEKENIVVRKSKKVFINNGKEDKIIVKSIDKKAKEEAKKILGLKKFLLDFSLISEREAKEVHLWENYLTFAMILNIADRIKKQFDKLYINVEAIQSFSKLFDTFAMLDIIANILYAGYLPLIVLIHFSTKKELKNKDLR